MTEKLGKTLQLLLVLAVIVESHYFILREPIVEPHDFCDTAEISSARGYWRVI